jgi:hypothetical protein
VLTSDQAVIIDSILEKRNESECLRIDIWVSCCSETTYSSIPPAQKDLLKLRNRGLIKFEDEFHDPEVTEYGESIRVQNMILRVIGSGLPDGNEYTDVKISKKLKDFGQDLDPAEISYELDVLKNQGFINGVKASSQQSFNERFIEVELLNRGIFALNKPNRVWVNNEEAKSQFTTNIKAESINALSTGSGHNIANSNITTSQDINQILECIKALKNSSEFLPNEEDQKESVEILEQIESGVISQDVTKVKMAYRAFCGILGAVSHAIPQVVDMTTQRLSTESR